MDERFSLANGLIRLSPAAIEDYASIYDHTALVWGVLQAELYNDMLDEAILDLVSSMHLGKRLANSEGTFYIFTKWKNARYGHNIIFVREPEGIYVLRILHSSMDVRSQSLPALDSREEEIE